MAAGARHGGTACRASCSGGSAASGGVPGRAAGQGESRTGVSAWSTQLWSNPRPRRVCSCPCRDRGPSSVGVRRSNGVPATGTICPLGTPPGASGVAGQSVRDAVEGDRPRRSGWPPGRRPRRERRSGRGGSRGVSNAASGPFRMPGDPAVDAVVVGAFEVVPPISGNHPDNPADEPRVCWGSPRRPRPSATRRGCDRDFRRLIPYENHTEMGFRGHRIASCSRPPTHGGVPPA